VNGLRPGSRQVECIQSAAGFTALRAQWHDLLRDSAGDTPFLTWEWLHSWWTQYGASGRLRLLVVRRGSVPIAIAPFHLVGGPAAGVAGGPPGGAAR
jgi:CelD/BcsL family acetyltransferase involved in cellulose biosynthesis